MIFLFGGFVGACLYVIDVFRFVEFLGIVEEVFFLCFVGCFLYFFDLIVEFEVFLVVFCFF